MIRLGVIYLGFALSLVLCSDLRSAEPGVLLSEIKPYREGKRPGLWIELFNCGKDSVPLSGWSLNSAEGRVCTFPPNTEIAGGKALLVGFGKKDDLHPNVTKHASLLLFDDNWPKAGILQCALVGRDSAIVDYVSVERCADRSQLDFEHRATVRGLWRPYSHVSPGRVKMFGCQSWVAGGAIARGGSCARPLSPMPGSKNTHKQPGDKYIPVWQILGPDYITPGLRNGWLIPSVTDFRNPPPPHKKVPRHIPVSRLACSPRAPDPFHRRPA